MVAIYSAIDSLFFCRKGKEIMLQNTCPFSQVNKLTRFPDNIMRFCPHGIHSRVDVCDFICQEMQNYPAWLQRSYIAHPSLEGCDNSEPAISTCNN